MQEVKTINRFNLKNPNVLISPKNILDMHFSQILYDNFNKEFYPLINVLRVFINSEKEFTVGKEPNNDIIIGQEYIPHFDRIIKQVHQNIYCFFDLKIEKSVFKRKIKFTFKF